MLAPMRRLVCVVLLAAAVGMPAGARAAADPLAVKGGRLVDGGDGRLRLRWTAAGGADTVSRSSASRTGSPSSPMGCA
jgi:hypothetical protein